MLKLRQINKSWKLAANQTPLEQRKNLVNVTPNDGAETRHTKI